MLVSHPPVFACILVGSFIKLLLPVPPSHLQHINTDLEVYFIFIFSSLKLPGSVRPRTVMDFARRFIPCFYDAHFCGGEKEEEEEDCRRFFVQIMYGAAHGDNLKRLPSDL